MTISGLRPKPRFRSAKSCFFSSRRRHTRWTGDWSSDVCSSDLPFERGHTALLVVDMQYLDAHWDYSMCRKIRDAGFERELLYYKDRLDLIVPNIRRLQNAFRTAGLEVMHARIQSMTGDGRDRGPSHKRLGHFAAPLSRDAEILDDLQPAGDEMVFGKTAGSVFSSTNIEYVLRNLEIRTLVVTGVVTTGCVHTAVTEAADRGFSVALVEDGCAALTEELHQIGRASCRERVET